MFCYSVNCEKTSPRINEAFAAGSGGTVTTSSNYLGGVSFLWGSPKIWWSVIKPAFNSGYTYYYADHLYMGRRYLFYRITKNRMQHTGNGYSDCSRFNKLGIKIKNWNKGRHIVVCPPDKAFAELLGFNADAWVENTKNILTNNTDRDIIWRDRLNIQRPIQEDLEDAHALVTYMSNSAVDALIDGVPVFCNGECAGKSMGLSDFSQIENPIYPDDRLRFLSVLADNQWTMEEIRTGLCWKMIGE